MTTADKLSALQSLPCALWIVRSESVFTKQLGWRCEITLSSDGATIEVKSECQMRSMEAAIDSCYDRCVKAGIFNKQTFKERVFALIGK